VHLKVCYLVHKGFGYLTLLNSYMFWRIE